jgi:hypothetical protein
MPGHTKRQIKMDHCSLLFSWSSGTLIIAHTQKLFSELLFGQNLGKAIYTLVQSLMGRCEELRSFIGGIQVGEEFNVRKRFLTGCRISFLLYHDFFEEPHPEPRSPVTLNFETGETRRHDYSRSCNPPILHRKEALLEKTHPRLDDFRF